MKAICLTICLLGIFLGAYAQIPQTITPHFSSWLKSNGYSQYNFDRTDIAGGSFGGKSSDSDTVVKQPVIFFHGNSDHAVGNFGEDFNGFTDSINYFLNNGYQSRELYITTWGPANQMLASQQYHSYNYVSYLRAFTEAVLKYTNATKIDIIAHSMGVTLARKVVKGGHMVDGGHSYDIGTSLAPKVDTFLGIAGGNLGLMSCLLSFILPTCSKEGGFFPGIAPGPVQLGTFLQDLLSNTEKEGAHVFTMLSTVDDIILNGDKVWGKYTSQFPTEDDSKIYNNLGHMAMKRQTYQEQFIAITQHKL